MRPVNLLPPSQRIKSGGGRPGSAYIVVGVLAAALVAVVMFVLTANQVTSKQDELAKAKDATAVAQARVAALGSFGDFAQIKQQREASVSQLAQARLDWERLMRELSRVLPENVFIDSLDAAVSGGATGPSGANSPSVKLSGCAPSQPDVATLMVRLRRLHTANDVKLTDSTRVEDGGGSGSGAGCGAGYAFTVIVTLEPAPAAATEKVPAHLGGGA